MKLNRFFNKIKFFSIAYEKDADVDTLKKMANELNGEMIVAPNAESLSKSFLKIIPNIYQWSSLFKLIIFDLHTIADNITLGYSNI